MKVVDLVIGICTKNCENTISSVMKKAASDLSEVLTFSSFSPDLYSSS